MVGELTSGEPRIPGVNLERGKCGVASRQRLSAEKPQQTLLSSRECHRYHSLSDWSELVFSLSERSSSENRNSSAVAIQASAI